MKVVEALELLDWAELVEHCTQAWSPSNCRQKKGSMITDWEQRQSISGSIAEC
jgi:hypothetical protein